MAQRKLPGQSPQARHGKKSTPSRHDKRARLARANPQRQRTEAASVPLVGLIANMATGMGRLLDTRIASRLPILLAGALLAGGRRTAASWFRAAGVRDDWDRFYECLQSVGRNAPSLMLPLAMFLVKRFDPGAGGYWKIASTTVRPSGSAAASKRPTYITTRRRAPPRGRGCMITVAGGRSSTGVRSVGNSTSATVATRDSSPVKGCSSR